MREVGPGGHFLGTAHTLAKFQSAFYAPKLLDNSSKTFVVRSNAIGVAGKIAQCVGVRLPNTVRQVDVEKEVARFLVLPLYATVAIKQLVHISDPTGPLVVIHVVLEIRERVAGEHNPVAEVDAHKTRLQHMVKQRLGATRTTEETLAPISALHLRANLTAVPELLKADPQDVGDTRFTACGMPA